MLSTKKCYNQKYSKYDFSNYLQNKILSPKTKKYT